MDIKNKAFIWTDKFGHVIADLPEDGSEIDFYKTDIGLTKSQIYKLNKLKVGESAFIVFDNYNFNTKVKVTRVKKK